MKSVKAFELEDGCIYGSESEAIAEVLGGAENHRFVALLETSDPSFEKELGDLIIRSAEIIQATRRKRAKRA
jgi:hypothetical protein